VKKIFCFSLSQGMYKINDLLIRNFIGEVMELSIFKRTANKKSETKKIRFEDGIPAVLYTAGKPSETIWVKKSEFNKIIRGLKEDRLSVTIFTLKNGNKKLRALVKEIQYHYTTYEVSHLDFFLLDDKMPVTVSVPIEYLGAEECAGVKLGGVLRRVIRKIKVRALPKDLPTEFSLDVTSLALGQAFRLKDIAMPANVKPCAEMDEVAVSVGKR
jgi:large subunit ribosomal protein L25